MIPAHTHFQGFTGCRVHLGVTGSVSAYRAVDVMRRLQHAGLIVGVSLSSAAQRFIQPLQFRSLTEGPVYDALFGPDQAAFAHLEPAQNARAFLVAPATANILAKHAHGIGDDLLSTQLLAFSGPVIHAPAMNPRIWNSIAVQKNHALLKERKVVVVEPESGVMACGEEGVGRLASTEEIFLATLKCVVPQDLAGLRVLVTLGPTREPLDPVRILTNPSSGIMGASIALAGWLRGAQVTIVSGPVDGLWLPRLLDPVRVGTAKEMHTACLDFAGAVDILCMTAAVCDYAAAQTLPDKAKKRDLGRTFIMSMQGTPDILAALGRRKKKKQVLVGFTAETSDPAAEAKRKLKDKNLDLILANRVDLPGIGFGSGRNQVLVLDRHGRCESWPILPKTEIAMRLFDWVADFLPVQ